MFSFSSGYRHMDANSQGACSAVDRVFNNYKLIELRIELKTIEKQLFEKSFPHEINSIGYDNTLHFIEQLDKLIKATYLIHDIYKHQLIKKPLNPADL